ncbi:hypothetical protein BU14_0184s0015 [Porphyra umbilicalis]|uniref:Uncharacterized protein n=1 Tax=Porphyra umbilicalis TaxID=2786 RepID=A0A1X6P6V2_PORUM|nr:hypothetical protein BU14_0184s0015 [Porphyra umbilicalis]|eukprot:OSX76588.1 hypothetical protein BU14_0184s0015 [Porphyra umbilicalis]
MDGARSPGGRCGGGVGGRGHRRGAAPHPVALGEAPPPSPSRRGVDRLAAGALRAAGGAPPPARAASPPAAAAAAATLSRARRRRAGHDAAAAARRGVRAWGRAAARGARRPSPRVVVGVEPFVVLAPRGRGPTQQRRRICHGPYRRLGRAVSSTGPSGPPPRGGARRGRRRRPGGGDGLARPARVAGSVGAPRRGPSRALGRCPRPRWAAARLFDTRGGREVGSAAPSPA